MDRLGGVRRSLASLGMAGVFGLGEMGHGVTRHGRRGKARLDKARSGMAWSGRHEIRHYTWQNSKI